MEQKLAPSAAVKELEEFNVLGRATCRQRRQTRRTDRRQILRPLPTPGTSNVTIFSFLFAETWPLFHCQAEPQARVGQCAHSRTRTRTRSRYHLPGTRRIPRRTGRNRRSPPRASPGPPRSTLGSARRYRRRRERRHCMHTKMTEPKACGGGEEGCSLIRRA